MLTQEQISENRERFISLVKSLDKPSDGVERLLSKLENSDFYKAPASTIYNNSFEGGLVAHLLSVYDVLVEIVKNAYPDSTTAPIDAYIGPYSMSSLIVVSLFHEMYKMNFYERDVKNKKVYSDHGKKSDELGKFDWVSVASYRVKDASDRFCFGTNEENSLRMIETFIPLKTEEACAILNHSGFYNKDYSASLSLCDTFRKYPLALFLYMADLQVTYHTDTNE